MFLLPHKEVVVFDLEYTDPSLAEAAGTFPQIVEIGAIKITSDLSEVSRFQTIVQPDRLDWFSEFSEQLTGIRRTQLLAAPFFTDVWRAFAEFTKFRDRALVSWGPESDIPVLRNAYMLKGLGYPHSNLAFDAKSICWGMAASIGLNLKGWSLAAACKYFDVPRPRKHRAIADAESIVSLFRKWDDSQERDEPYTLIEV